MAELSGFVQRCTESALTAAGGLDFRIEVCLAARGEYVGLLT